MTMHCRCNLEQENCVYPNCHSGNYDNKKGLDILDELKMLADMIDSEPDGEDDNALSILLIRAIGEIRKLRAATVPAEVPRTCSDERPCIPCFTDNGACLGPARVPASEPITDEQLLKLMKAVDPETVRLPPGIKKIAAAIENAGYVRGLAEKGN